MLNHILYLKLMVLIYIVVSLLTSLQHALGGEVEIPIIGGGSAFAQNPSWHTSWRQIPYEKYGHE
jgi:hypothetical protein